MNAPATLFQRAAAMLERHDGAGALRVLHDSGAAASGDATLRCCYADALHMTGDRTRARLHYQAAVAIDPDLFEAWYGLGCAALEQHGYAVAIAALARATALQPDFAPGFYNQGKALFEMGEVDAAMRCFRHAARDPAARNAALLSIACIIPGDPASDHHAVRDARAAFAASLRPTLPPSPQQPPRPLHARQDKLRIGYISSFFDRQNWMKPVFGVINAHDRDRHEIHLFSDAGLPSAEAGYHDHPADLVHELRGAPNALIADAIAAAGIDVLVDLNGYSNPARLPVLLQRPAPRILGWFNMFATTGMPEYDALIGDDRVIRPHEEAYYPEPILRVPGSYLAFSVLYDVPPLAPPPCMANGAITFGCLGSQYKLTDAVLASWSRILHGCPGARLLLKSKPLNDADNCDAVRARFAANGIAADRLILEPGEAHAAFLQAYDRIDIALDTFPYNGGTTTTEALWQGVPVLSFDGDRWASRTSASLLHAAGLADWVMPDQAGYEARAVALGTDPATPARLRSLRAGMRDRLGGSPVCNSVGLARALEAIYARQVVAGQGAG